MGIDFSHPIRQSGDCTMPGWGGTPTFSQVLRTQGNLATAAIMTVIGPSASPQWNTPDGHRWTQPEAIAARQQHGIIPVIEAPWLLKRTGPDFVGAVPDSVTVWLIGGKVGQDWTYGGNCIAGEADPMPGSSYLMLFGPQQNLAPSPGAYRVILAAYPYSPVTHALDGPWGRVWLAPPPARTSSSG